MNPINSAPIFESPRLFLGDTQALLIDVQEKLTPHIHNHQQMLQKIITLIQGLQALDVPIMRNEQYKKGLGDTVPEILAVLDEKNQQSFEKKSFSVYDDHQSPVAQHINRYINHQKCKNVLLFGIETHVCVMQTALDLLNDGFRPVVVVDAVGSRHDSDKQIALRRMERLGVVMTSVEAVLFELCRTADHPAFKTISKLVK